MERVSGRIERETSASQPQIPNEPSRDELHEYGWQDRHHNILTGNMVSTTNMSLKNTEFVLSSVMPYPMRDGQQAGKNASVGLLSPLGKHQRPKPRHSSFTELTTRRTQRRLRQAGPGSRRPLLHQVSG